MKFLSFFILLLAFSSQANSMSLQDVEQLFIGVLSGVGDAADITAVLPCVQDSISIGTDLEIAVKDFMTGGSENVKDGLRLLGEAIQTLPDAMTQCGLAGTQVQKIYSLLKSFTSPQSFAYHVGMDLVVNGVQIYQDIENLLAAYHAVDWRQVGYYSGHAMSKIIVGQTVASTLALNLDTIKEIFIGVLEGIAVEANFTALESCLTESTTAGSDFVQAIEYFMKKTEADVKTGLKLLGQAIELLPDAMTQCEQSVQDAKRLYQMIANFKNPWSFSYHVALDLLVNGVQIFHNINAAINAYQGQQWQSFGYNSGYALALVLLGSTSATERL